MRSYALDDVVDAILEQKPVQLMDAILTYWHTACAATHWIMWLIMLGLRSASAPPADPGTHSRRSTSSSAADSPVSVAAVLPYSLIQR